MSSLNLSIVKAKANLKLRHSRTKIKNKIITLGLGSKRNKLKMIGMMISKEELTMRK